MQGATHRAGGVTAMLVGYSYLHSKGLPIVDNAPIASFVAMYPFAIWGSTASDLDHYPGSVWDEVKLIGERHGHTIPSQDIVSRAISRLLHLTHTLRKVLPPRSRLSALAGVLDCKHRSWQTHSELPLVLLWIALALVNTSATNTTLSSTLWVLILNGVILGLIAHLCLDLLTPEGLPFATGLFVNRVLLGRKVLPERIKIIPHRPPTKKGEPGFFSTGGTWEKKIVFNILHAVNLVLFGYLIYSTFIAPYTSIEIR